MNPDTCPHCGLNSINWSDICNDDGITGIRSYVCYERELSQLREWKESAIAVTPPLQEIGRELGLGLGQTIHDNILPGIVRLRAELSEARKIISESTPCLWEDGRRKELKEVVAERDAERDHADRLAGALKASRKDLEIRARFTSEWPVMDVSNSVLHGMDTALTAHEARRKGGSDE